MMQVRDRTTGARFRERVFGGAALELLYGTSLRGRVLRTLARHRLASWIYGWAKRRGSTRRDIAAFVESLGIDATEAELPVESYASLGDFFERRLRPGARPIDHTPGHLVSPCDGRVLAFPRLDATLEVKRSRITLDVLLGDSALAGRHRGGAALVARLAPADYHRFHFPDGGVARQVRRIAGALDSVHPIALAAGAASFENARIVTLLESDGFGRIAMIEVGAMLVGTIVQTHASGRVERGAEKGFFRFGGSTIVLLFEPGRVELDGDLLEATRAGVESLVRMGSRIGRAP
jgi:phosphatidylserine decarboxylase